MARWPGSQDGGSSAFDFFQGREMVEGADVHDAGDGQKHIDAGDNEHREENSFDNPGNEHVRGDCAREMVVQLSRPGGSGGNSDRLDL